jgi:hypothetical protein
MGESEKLNRGRIRAGMEEEPIPGLESSVWGKSAKIPPFGKKRLLTTNYLMPRFMEPLTRKDF